MRDALCDCTEIDAEIESILQEAEVLAEMIQRAVDENSSVALDQDAYNKRYDSLVERYETSRGRLAELKAQRTERQKKAEVINRFVKHLAVRDEPLTTFTDGLWIDSVDHVTVQLDGSLVFHFQDGREVTV